MSDRGYVAFWKNARGWKRPLSLDLAALLGTDQCTSNFVPLPCTRGLPSVRDNKRIMKLILTIFICVTCMAVKFTFKELSRYCKHTLLC